MWYETVIPFWIDWQAVSLDGFRPRGKKLHKLLTNYGMDYKFRGDYADRGYCYCALDIKKRFHDGAKKRGLTVGDKCLTHFVIPAADYVDILDEVKRSRTGGPASYRIMVFQFPKGSCSVYKSCIENLVEKIGFAVKESYRDPIDFRGELRCLLEYEITNSRLHIPEVRWAYQTLPDRDCFTNYNDKWPKTTDVGYSSFEKWYLDISRIEYLKSRSVKR